jgi:hypothetical protein
LFLNETIDSTKFNINASLWVNSRKGNQFVWHGDNLPLTANLAKWISWAVLKVAFGRDKRHNGRGNGKEKFHG